jgi:hypothetical protein
LFDIARKCCGMERTGCSASLARRVKTDTTCEDIGGMRAVRLCKTPRRVSASDD